MSSVMGGGGSAKAASKAANLQAQYQREALDYLKQTEKLPQAYREGALNQLGGEYGFTQNANGDVTSDGTSILSRAQSSPFYTAAVKAGEDSVLRNASATGGLRSGSANEALADVNQNALLQSYNMQLNGLNGLASLPSNANNIAGLTSDIGQTLAQGKIASATASAQGSQNQFNNLAGLGSLAIQGFAAFSDRRLKRDISYIGEQKGHKIYSWVWNDEANKLGLHGESHGVLADEVEAIRPEAVSEKDGYKQVDYAMLGVTHGL